LQLSEARETIKGYSKDQLKALVIALYKSLPADRKKDIGDPLLQNPDDALASKPRLIAEKPKPDIHELELDIDEFIKNAQAQNYFAPNRIISKNERTRWRFLVKQYYRDLLTAGSVEEDLPLAASLLSRLYRLLCYACGYYLFRTENPFQSIGISQTEFLKQVLTLNKRCQESRVFISGGLNLAVGNGVDRITLPRWLIDVFLDFLTTPDLCESAVEICGNIIQEKKQKTVKPHDSMAEWEHTASIRDFALAGFLLHAKLHDFESAVAFFRQHYHQHNPEVTLFYLLELLEEFNQKELYLREYRRACSDGIKPRSELTKTYDQMQAGA
jgi:hypothetical protein